jgi:hypothetical protein
MLGTTGLLAIRFVGIGKTHGSPFRLDWPGHLDRVPPAWVERWPQEACAGADGRYIWHRASHVTNIRSVAPRPRLRLPGADRSAPRRNRLREQALGCRSDVADHFSAEPREPRPGPTTQGAAMGHAARHRSPARRPPRRRPASGLPSSLAPPGTGPDGVTAQRRSGDASAGGRCVMLGRLSRVITTRPARRVARVRPGRARPPGATAPRPSRPRSRRRPARRHCCRPAAQEARGRARLGPGAHRTLRAPGLQPTRRPARQPDRRRCCPAVGGGGGAAEGPAVGGVGRPDSPPLPISPRPPACGQRSEEPEWPARPSNGAAGCCSAAGSLYPRPTGPPPSLLCASSPEARPALPHGRWPHPPPRPFPTTNRHGRTATASAPARGPDGLMR